MGHFGPKRAIFDPFFDPLLGPPGHMGPYGAIWAIYRPYIPPMAGHMGQYRPLYGPYGPYGLEGPKRGQKGVQNVVPKIGVSAGVMGEILGFNRGIGVLGPPKRVIFDPFLGSFLDPLFDHFWPKTTLSKINLAQNLSQKWPKKWSKRGQK